MSSQGQIGNESETNWKRFGNDSETIRKRFGNDSETLPVSTGNGGGNDSETAFPLKRALETDRKRRFHQESRWKRFGNDSETIRKRFGNALETDENQSRSRADAETREKHSGHGSQSEKDPKQTRELRTSGSLAQNGTDIRQRGSQMMFGPSQVGHALGIRL